MDHAEATAIHATDRYLLGELTAAEADAFEEHYFDCPACADDLRVGMQLLDGGRKLGREASAPAAARVVPLAPRRGRRAWWISSAAAAALALALFAPLLLRLGGDGGPAMQVASQHSFLDAETRGASDVPTLDGTAAIVLPVDVPPEPAYPRYEAQLHQPNGKVLTLPFTPDPTGAPTMLTLTGLTAGAHELAIAGIAPAGRTELKRHRFVVRR